MTLLAARRAARELFAGPFKTNGTSVRALIRPSLAFMAMPVIFGVNLQGYLLLVGAHYGAAALAAFAATRTLTRLLDLLTSLAYGLHYYESGYLTGDRLAVQCRILATTTLAALAIALAFSLLLLAIGPWLQPLYTDGQTRFDTGVAAVLLGAASLRALAAAPLAALAAENRHGGAIAAYLAGSLVSLCGAAVLAAAGAPLAACLALLIVAEAAQTLPAFAAALRYVELSPAAFLRSLVSAERIADVALLARTLRRAA